MGRTWIAAATVSCLLLGAGPLVAEEGDGKGKGEGKAVLALVPGKAVPFVLTVETESVEEGGLHARMRAAGMKVPEDRMRTVEERSVEILGPEEGEGKTGTRAVIRLGLVTVRGADLAGENREFRSDTKAPEGIVLMPDAIDAIAPGGAELPVILDRGGVPISVAVPAGLEEARAKVLAIGQDGKSLLGFHLREHTLLPRMNHPFTAAPLPSSAVGPGDRWEAAPLLLEKSTGFEMVLVPSLRVEAVDGTEVRLAGTGRVEVRDPASRLLGKEARKRLKETFGDPPEVKKSSASLKFRLSRADGLPLSGSGEASWETLAKSPGDAKKTTTKAKVRWTLERVEAWPSGLPHGGAKGAKK